jgi:hypothetical protein
MATSVDLLQQGENVIEHSRRARTGETILYAAGPQILLRSPMKHSRDCTHDCIPEVSLR